MKRWWLACLVFLIFPASAEAEEGLTLKQCYELALAYSDRVAISNEEINAARARFSQGLGEVLPQITFQFSELLQDPSGSGGNNPVGQTFTRLSRTQGAFNFQQILFRGFQEYQGLKILRLEETRTRQEKAEVERLLFQDVAIAFYTAGLIERDIATDKMIREVIQKRVNDLAERVKLGKSREGELAQEKAALALLEADIVREEGQRAVAYEMMSFLTGVDPMPPLRWSDPVTDPDRPVAAYLEQIPGRPDLEAAQTTTEIAKRNIDFVRGNFLPTVDLEANVYTFRPGFQSDIHWDTEIRAEVPIFKYQNFGAYREAKIRSKQSDLEAENLLRIARREVQDAYESYMSSRAQYQSYLQAVSLSYQNFLLQNEDFKLGRATNLDVLTAQRTWLESLEQRNRSEAQTWLDWTQLQIASGVMP
jgi:outer membrane protein TolC